MMNRIKKLVRWARVSKGGADDKQFPSQQVEYMGKVGNCVMIFPYGMHANASIDSIVAMFSMGGNSADRAGIPSSPIDRPKMAKGEVCFYHPVTQSIIHFKNDGSIDITAPEMVLNGNMTINGNLDVTGATTLSDTVTSNGKDISDTHTHSQGNDSDGNVQVDTDGVV